MRKKDTKNRIRRLALCGLFTAIMLILGFFESQLPAGPIPGIKLGLSNSILVFAVCMLDIPTAFLLMILKVTLSGFMFGSISAMMYAFAGGFLSMITMSLLSRIKGVHIIVISMAGGMMHNVGQVALAMLILKTPQLMYYMAVLMGAGLACGALSGICADRVIRILKTTEYGRSFFEPHDCD